MHSLSPPKPAGLDPIFLIFEKKEKKVDFFSVKTRSVAEQPASTYKMSNYLTCQY
jgi:hypothetical protein